MDDDYSCQRCGDPVNRARYEIGYTTCKPCGERAARKVRHTIVPMPKSNYIVLPPDSARELLRGLNSSHKRGA